LFDSVRLKKVYESLNTIHEMVGYDNFTFAEKSFELTYRSSIPGSGFNLGIQEFRDLGIQGFKEFYLF